jgi:hypothetical protein
MANDITNKTSTNLPMSADFVNKLLGGIRVSRQQTPLASNEPLLRFLKDGRWVFGQQDDEIEATAILAAHPMFINHGYVCWERKAEGQTGPNELLDEKMVPVFEDKPAMPGPIQGHPYKDQRTMLMVVTNGDDKGTQMLFKTSSYGGLRCVDDFLAELEKQLATDPSKPVALLQLLKDGYKHKTHGWIATPHFKVVGWRAVGDDTEPVAAAQPKGNGGGAAAAPAAAPSQVQQTGGAPAQGTGQPAGADEVTKVAEQFRQTRAPRRARSGSASPI